MPETDAYEMDSTSRVLAFRLPVYGVGVDDRVVEGGFLSRSGVFSVAVTTCAGGGTMACGIVEIMSSGWTGGVSGGTALGAEC